MKLELLVPSSHAMSQLTTNYSNIIYFYIEGCVIDIKIQYILK